MESLRQQAENTYKIISDEAKRKAIQRYLLGIEKKKFEIKNMEKNIDMIESGELPVFPFE